jgi:hypothetical protein
MRFVMVKKHSLFPPFLPRGKRRILEVIFHMPVEPDILYATKSFA